MRTQGRVSRVVFRAFSRSYLAGWGVLNAFAYRHSAVCDCHYLTTIDCHHSSPRHAPMNEHLSTNLAVRQIWNFSYKLSIGLNVALSS